MWHKKVLTEYNAYKFNDLPVNRAKADAIFPAHARIRPHPLMLAVSVAAVTCTWAGLAHAASGGTDTAGIGQPVCNQDNAYNIACGKSSSASGNTATAVGYGASASSQNATAVGPNANAANINAIAVGASANATGNGAITTGAYSSAAGTYGSAYGIAAKAAGNYSAAVGAGAEGVGHAATAAGAYSEATGNFSASFGVGAESGTTPPSGQTGTNTTAVGAYSKAQGDYSTALGSNAEAKELGTLKNPLHGGFQRISSRGTIVELTPFQSLTRFGGVPFLGRTGVSKGFSRRPIV